MPGPQRLSLVEDVDHEAAKLVFSNTGTVAIARADLVDGALFSTARQRLIRACYLS